MLEPSSCTAPLSQRPRKGRRRRRRRPGVCMISLILSQVQVAEYCFLGAGGTNGREPTLTPVVRLAADWSRQNVLTDRDTLTSVSWPADQHSKHCNMEIGTTTQHFTTLHSTQYAPQKTSSLSFTMSQPPHHTPPPLHVSPPPYLIYNLC